MPLTDSRLNRLVDGIKVFIKHGYFADEVEVLILE